MTCCTRKRTSELARERERERRGWIKFAWMQVINTVETLVEQVSRPTNCTTLIRVGPKTGEISLRFQDWRAARQGAGHISSWTSATSLALPKRRRRRPVKRSGRPAPMVDRASLIWLAHRRNRKRWRPNGGEQRVLSQNPLQPRPRSQ